MNLSVGHVSLAVPLPFWSMAPGARRITRPWLALVVGAGLLACAEGGRLVLGVPFGSQNGSVLFVPAIIAAAFLGGTGPGLLVTFLTLAVTSDFLLDIRNATAFHYVRAITLLFTGLISSVMCDALRRARWRSEMAAIQYSVTLNSIGDAVIAADMQGRVTMMNAAAEQLTGWTVAEALHQDLGDVFQVRGEDGDDIPANLVERIRRNGVIMGLSGHSMLRTRSGIDIPIEESAAPIAGDDGVVEGIILVFRDCSERKRHDREVHEQAERYMRLLEVSPDAVLVNRDGRIVLVNQAALRLFGAAAAEDLLGKSPLELFHPDYHVFVSARIERLRSGLAVPRAEEKIVRLDGSVVDVDVVASPFVDQGSMAIHVVLRDISEHKVAERELRQWADAFTHCAHGLALSHPPTGKIVVCNPAFARILGYAVEELAGAPILSVYHPSMVEKLPGYLTHAETNGHVCYEADMVRKDGSVLVVQMDLVTVHDNSGKLLYRVATIQDITERKAAAAEIQRLQANLERTVEERTAELMAANKELDAFTYAVSHDLRAPLRAMSGFSQALLEDYGADLNGDAKTYLGHITQASKRMGELVEGLLVLSRTTRYDVQRTTVDLTAIAERVRTELEAAEPDRHVTWDIAGGLEAHGDPRLLGVLMDNLLRNAWKYSGQKPQALIRVGVEHGPNGPVFFVADNGAGFDMAHAGKLFQPFQRLHRQDEFPGIGIGLATVQRVVNRHAGTIWGEGVPGKGATFRFTLAPPPNGPVEEFL